MVRLLLGAPPRSCVAAGGGFKNYRSCYYMAVGCCHARKAAGGTGHCHAVAILTAVFLFSKLRYRFLLCEIMLLGTI